jgi:uncharacterized surface protein with fasciclin (FAS1) repeats
LSVYRSSLHQTVALPVISKAGRPIALGAIAPDRFHDLINLSAIASKPAMPNIVEIAVGNDAFKTLVAAVQAADLVEVLQSPGPFTVFAPVDDAFAKLPPGTVQTLVQNPPQLGRILKYHVVPGKYTRADLQKLDTISSAEGADISLNVTDDCFEVKNATVVMADVEADNGIIHVIDNVILMG